ncbi:MULTISPECIES: TetR/AcrR family transcriptional regulator [unclassified Corynebacterium]|uniref:TetR/AcrR family transcriptional regulator n=1 Tax=unclassified Corynebacterium TaxID=2624378 RepID=UPI0008A11508|nr:MULTISPECIES: TetR/AcrR family transcriptional regulator [unclassified Corynebacterium]OFP36820.1 TetR family transcriptional regulator [Corynebacterium sp. HMSC071B10]OHF38308.1 TetR family transcriptional regulator [Corynebacterium sp. HMSC074A01]
MSSGTAKKKTTARRRNRPSPRQRLLDAATKLFTEEGIRVIGIDRILREADVAKASLYSLLGSKDNLVIAYLERMDEEYRQRWEERAVKASTTDEKVLAFFDMAIETEPQREFRGSPFLNAATEYPRPETESEHRIVETCRNHRKWMHGTITELLTAKNGYDSSKQADELLIFLDGGMTGARFMRDVSPLQKARDLAESELGAPPADYSI